MFGIILLLIVVTSLIIWALYEKYKLWREPIDKLNSEINFLKQYGCPYSQPYIYASGFPDVAGRKDMWAWKDNDELKFLQGTGEIKIIHCEDVLFFTVRGGLKTNTQNTNRNSGTLYTSLTEGLFGTAAAMKNSQIISNVYTFDERHTILKVKIDNSVKFIVFEKGDLYNYLLEQIPEKEQSFVEMQSTI